MLQIADSAHSHLLTLPAKRSVSSAIDAKIGEIRSVARPQQYKAKGNLSERLFDSAASFKVAFSQISMHLPKEWRDALFRQLDSLLDVNEWDERDIPPMAQSQLTFIRLLLALKPERRPGLGASQDGRLIAAWTVDRNRLTIECLPNDHVTWSLSRTVGDEVERATGTTMILRMADILSPYDPSVWFNLAK